MVRAIQLIFFRDLKSYLKSPVFFFLLAGCSLIWGFTFLQSSFGFMKLSLQAQSSSGIVANLHQSLVLPHISWVNIMLIFIVPLITMKIIADQKKDHSFILLMTAPVKSYQIAIGKFGACFAATLAFIFVSGLYPLILSFISDMHITTLLCAYLGLILITGVYCSIGLFASALTTSTTLAGMIAILANLSLFLVKGISVGFENKVLRSFLSLFEVVNHFWKFLSGYFVLSSFVFLISVILLFVFLCERAIESARWQ